MNPLFKEHFYTCLVVDNTPPFLFQRDLNNLFNFIEPEILLTAIPTNQNNNYSLLHRDILNIEIQLINNSCVSFDSKEKNIFITDDLNISSFYLNENLLFLCGLGKNFQSFAVNNGTWITSVNGTPLITPYYKTSSLSYSMVYIHRKTLEIYTVMHNFHHLICKDEYSVNKYILSISNLNLFN